MQQASACNVAGPGSAIGQAAYKQVVVRKGTEAGLGPVIGLVYTLGMCGGGACVFDLRVGRVQGCCGPCTRRGGVLLYSIESSWRSFVHASQRIWRGKTCV